MKIPCYRTVDVTKLYRLFPDIEICIFNFLTFFCSLLAYSIVSFALLIVKW